MENISQEDAQEMLSILKSIIAHQDFVTEYQKQLLIRIFRVMKSVDEKNTIERSLDRE